MICVHAKVWKALIFKFLGKSAVCGFYVIILGSWIFRYFPETLKFACGHLRAITWPPWIVIPFWSPCYSVPPIAALLNPYTGLGSCLPLIVVSPLQRIAMSDQGLRVPQALNSHSKEGMDPAAPVQITGLDRGEMNGVWTPTFSQMEVPMERLCMNSFLFPPTTLRLAKPWNIALLPRVRASSWSWKIMRIQRSQRLRGQL